METKKQYKEKLKIICFFEKINKFDKPLAKVYKGNGERTQIFKN
jgi:hypothetical protein